MKGIFGKIYAVLLFVLMAAGEALVVFFFARNAEKSGAAIALALAGWVLSCVLSPIAHEAGHIVFAKANGMRLKMTKFSFFRWTEQDGKLRFSFASPFAAEETQTVPLSGGNMKKRASLYTAGGLIFGAGYLGILLAAVLIFRRFVGEETAFLFWGGIPYAAYLFFLNLPPFVYGGGKTDGAVLGGIKKNAPEETAMVCAMEIYGQLSEGKSFSQIDEKRYLDLPVVAEDTPLYAISLDLKYRYFLEKGDMKCAADCINRLAKSSQYLSERAFEETAAELTYMHSVSGDAALAQESGKLCEHFLLQENATAKRVLGAYCAAIGKQEEAAALRAQGEKLLGNEPIAGVRKFEKILFARIG